MEKINLNAFEESYYIERVAEARARAVFLVEQEIIPMLETAVRDGYNKCNFEIIQKDVYVSDVKKEILKRVRCNISFGRAFVISW